MPYYEQMQQADNKRKIYLRMSDSHHLNHVMTKNSPTEKDNDPLFNVLQ